MSKFNIFDWVRTQEDNTPYYIYKVVLNDKHFVQNYSYVCKYYDEISKEIKTTSLHEDDLQAINKPIGTEIYAYLSALQEKYKHVNYEVWEEFCKQLAFEVKMRKW